MAIANIIAKGIGFSPGSVKFIPTHGFGGGAAATITVAAEYGIAPEPKRRRRTLVTMPDGRTVEPRDEYDLRRLLAELQLADEEPVTPPPKTAKAKRAATAHRRDVIAAQAAEIPDEWVDAVGRLAAEADGAALAWQRLAELWRSQAAAAAAETDNEETIMILLAVLA